MILLIVGFTLYVGALTTQTNLGLILGHILSLALLVPGVGLLIKGGKEI